MEMGQLISGAAFVFGCSTLYINKQRNVKGTLWLFITYGIQYIFDDLVLWGKLSLRLPTNQHESYLACYVFLPISSL